MINKTWVYQVYFFYRLYNNIIFPTFKWSWKRSRGSCSLLAEWEQLWVSRSSGRILYQLPLLFLVVPARLYSNKNARARLESDLTEKWSPCSCFSWLNSSSSFLSLQLQRVINQSINRVRNEKINTVYNTETVFWHFVILCQNSIPVVQWIAISLD